MSASTSENSVSLKVSVTETNSHIANSVLLATARITVSTDNGRNLQLRALIDTGSEATFITERVAQTLRARRSKVHVQVTGLGSQTNGIVRYRTNLTLRSCNNKENSVPVSAFILPNLTSYKPISSISKDKCPDLRDLTLADSNPSSHECIDLLIGADIYGAVLLDGLRKLNNDALVAQHTIFGWILVGSCNQTHNSDLTVTSSLQCSVSDSIDDALRKFWEIEEVPSLPSPSTEDQLCEEHFLSTHSRLSNGRYVVRLPTKPDFANNLGKSFHKALKLLNHLERRLSSNFKLDAAYKDFLNEYSYLGHMAPLTSQEILIRPSYYLPHHAVLKESSTSPVLCLQCV